MRKKKSTWNQKNMHTSIHPTPTVVHTTLLKYRIDKKYTPNTNPHLAGVRYVFYLLRSLSLSLSFQNSAQLFWFYHIATAAQGLAQTFRISAPPNGKSERDRDRFHRFIPDDVPRGSRLFAPLPASCRVSIATQNRKTDWWKFEKSHL